MTETQRKDLLKNVVKNISKKQNFKRKKKEIIWSENILVLVCTYLEEGEGCDYEYVGSS